MPWPSHVAVVNDSPHECRIPAHIQANDCPSIDSSASYPTDRVSPALTLQHCTSGFVSGLVTPEDVDVVGMVGDGVGVGAAVGDAVGDSAGCRRCCRRSRSRFSCFHTDGCSRPAGNSAGCRRSRSLISCFHTDGCSRPTGNSAGPRGLAIALVFPATIMNRLPCRPIRAPTSFPRNSRLDSLSAFLIFIHCSFNFFIGTVAPCLSFTASFRLWRNSH